MLHRSTGSPRTGYRTDGDAGSSFSKFERSANRPSRLSWHERNDDDNDDDDDAKPASAPAVAATAAAAGAAAARSSAYSGRWGGHQSPADEPKSPTKLRASGIVDEKQHRDQQVIRERKCSTERIPRNMFFLYTGWIAYCISWERMRSGVCVGINLFFSKKKKKADQKLFFDKLKNKDIRRFDYNFDENQNLRRHSVAQMTSFPGFLLVAWWRWTKKITIALTTIILWVTNYVLLYEW